MSFAITAPLPGKTAHLSMAPAYRCFGIEHGAIPPDAVDAAVMALLTPVNEGRTPEDILDWPVLLIRRSTYDGVHSGQIALPGGKAEKEDGDLWHTALRETWEEVGIEQEYAEYAGALSDMYVPPSNFRIRPFVAVNNWRGPLRLSEAEVAAHITAPVRAFDPQAASLQPFTCGDGEERPAPSWTLGGCVVWGATAMILAELFSLVASGGLARVEA